MSVSLSIATYFICWWMALFMILPIGVKTQEEEGEIVPGTVESAPSNPHILRKMLATCVLGFVFFAMIYSQITYEIISLDDLPFLSKF